MSCWIILCNNVFSPTGLPLRCSSITLFTFNTALPNIIFFSQGHTHLILDRPLPQYVKTVLLGVIVSIQQQPLYAILRFTVHNFQPRLSFALLGPIVLTPPLCQHVMHPCSALQDQLYSLYVKQAFTVIQPP